MIFSLVGVLGIEPSLHEPESCVLPAYATPASTIIDFYLTKYQRQGRTITSWVAIPKGQYLGIGKRWFQIV